MYFVCLRSTFFARSKHHSTQRHRKWSPSSSATINTPMHKTVASPLGRPSTRSIKHKSLSCADTTAPSEP